ncbi:MAG TPA: hypothetical protein PL182_10045, partial [Pseudobdellovibrionaceae bacterium]|nr:hypothetical protein [Pseudobdellovibrionaceae bacterium]
KDVKTASLDKQNADDGLIGSLSSYFLPAKRSVMKMYQMPYLLQNSLLVQEKPYLPDPRDLLFARQWASDRTKAIRSPEALKKEYPLAEMSVGQKLFQEIRKEVELEDKIYPTPLAKAFNAKADGLTIVYVPGIYNSIFDKEIFSLGLQALKDDLGLRVIQPPVESTCSADVNGQKILNFIYQDMKDRVERQHKTPRYLFISYSKGAVDTLNFFTQYPGFVSTYVAGMVAVAAPLHGASILDKSDLPVALVSALSEGDVPAVCRQDKTAASSLTPSAMDSFWRRHERSLIGLTRYFSLTFKSTPEDSHLFMRAAKLIAQFDEDNDGVVTVTSSKFPDSLRAVDLGTVEADHLAGILSSNFNQKSFMKSVVNTVAELDVLNWRENFKWNTRAIVEAASTPGRFFTSKPSLKGLIYSNSWELNRQLLPPRNDPADTYEPRLKLPATQFRYDPDLTLDIQKMPDVMAKTRVTPATPQNMPEGIRIEYAHSHMVHFRMDHRFNYESRSPVGLDDNEAFGVFD